jgi:AcrR family transcriptional regulator
VYDGLVAATDSRERVLQALMAIIGEQGLEQATIREVAAAAGVSIGTVQYYCRSKDEMLQTAFEHVAERILERATGLEKAGPVGAVLRRGLLEVLPLDERRAVEGRVYLAFVARAAVAREMRTRCEEALRLAAERGQARAGLDVEAAAAAIVVTVDGLILHMLTDPDAMPADRAVSIVDEHLRRYLELPDAPAPASEDLERR